MIKRRDFIRKSILGTVGISIGGMGFSSKSYASIIGANDRINIAVVGLRSRGNAHIDEWSFLKDKFNVRLVTLCDADEQFFTESSKDAFDKTGVKQRHQGRFLFIGTSSFSQYLLSSWSRIKVYGR